MLEFGLLLSRGTIFSKCRSISSGGTSSPARSMTRAAIFYPPTATEIQYFSTLPLAGSPWSNLTSVGTVTSYGYPYFGPEPVVPPSYVLPETQQEVRQGLQDPKLPQNTRPASGVSRRRAPKWSWPWTTDMTDPL